MIILHFRSFSALFKSATYKTVGALASYLSRSRRAGPAETLAEILVRVSYHSIIDRIFSDAHVQFVIQIDNFAKNNHPYGQISIFTLTLGNFLDFFFISNVANFKLKNRATGNLAISDDSRPYSYPCSAASRA